MQNDVLAMTRRLPTGCVSIDGMLSGGFRFGSVSLIYGEAATGKTTMALSCIVNHLRNNPLTKAYYIDSDQKISVNRLLQIANDEKLLKQLLIWRPTDFCNQIEVVEEMLELLPVEGAPLVVDSVTSLYRLEAGKPETTFAANKELNRQLGFLAETARTKNAAVLLVGQVHSVMESSANDVEPVAQRLLNYWSDTVLKLENVSSQGRRLALVEKPAYPSKAAWFKIGGSGLEEVDKAW